VRQSEKCRRLRSQKYKFKIGPPKIK